jgi:branched-chain amino acid transport system substrate-binding protein
MRFPFRSACVALLVAALVLPANAQDRSPYLIGAILSISGNDARAGLSAAASLDAVVRNINATGGIAGHSLEVRMLDDGSSPERAAGELDRFAAEPGLLAVIGGSSTATGDALAKAADAAQVPFLSIAPRDSGADPTLPWVFRLAVPESDRLGLLIGYAKRHALSPLAVLYADDDYGKREAKLSGALAAAAGLAIVDSEPLAVDGHGDDAVVVRAKAKAPHSFLTFTAERGPGILAKAMSAKAPGIAALADAPSATDDFLRAAGQEAVYWRIAAPKVAVSRLVAPGDPLHAAIAGFVKLYPPQIAPDAAAGTARDAIVMLAGALKSAGRDRAKIRAALESGTPFAGVMGTYRLTPADHGAVDLEGLTLIEGSGGAWKAVD